MSEHAFRTSSCAVNSSVCVHPAGSRSRSSYVTPPPPPPLPHTHIHTHTPSSCYVTHGLPLPVAFKSPTAMTVGFVCPQNSSRGKRSLLALLWFLYKIEKPKEIGSSHYHLLSQSYSGKSTQICAFHFAYPFIPAEVSIFSRSCVGQSLGQMAWVVASCFFLFFSPPSHQLRFMEHSWSWHPIICASCPPTNLPQ